MLETIRVRFETTRKTDAKQIRNEICAMWKKNYGKLNIACELHQLSSISKQDDGQYAFSLSLTQTSDLENITSLPKITTKLGQKSVQIYAWSKNVADCIGGIRTINLNESHEEQIAIPKATLTAKHTI